MNRLREHEEQGAGEIWLGNTLADGSSMEKYGTLKTVRVGKQAYDIHGKKIAQDYYLPLFIHESEEMKLEAIHKAISAAVKKQYREGTV